MARRECSDCRLAVQWFWLSGGEGITPRSQSLQNCIHLLRARPRFWSRGVGAETTAAGEGSSYCSANDVSRFPAIFPCESVFGSLGSRERTSSQSQAHLHRVEATLASQSASLATSGVAAGSPGLAGRAFHCQTNQAHYSM